ncbi:MAG: Rad52/Rad22 family DNA repair protein [Pyrinomonadaceae bacterium]
MSQVKKNERLTVLNAATSDNVLDFGETLRELRKNVDPNLVRQREGRRDRSGNVQMVDYVEWHTVADILDETAPNWGHSIKDMRQIGDVFTVTVAISIDGVTREGIGTGSAHSDMGIKKAEHDALKRAAVKFGIARELYKKAFAAVENEWNGTAGAEVPAFPAEPVAASLTDLVTAKQLAMIRAISREADVDAEEECKQLLNCGTSELSKKAASSFIDHLLRIQKYANAAPPPLRRAG